MTERHPHGVDPAELEDAVLMHELAHLHATRHDTFLHGSDDALDRHTERTAELEQEYLRRHPHRQVTRGRTREGARAREIH
ncbi:DUF6158 family protein [Allostreptomyces psammosilenae]|uniref:Uncharacterized protein n=1 Tax=Allostreptomyces psammosilenae TaxID=1892865 RepID=A0A853A184_9ACTN|nr:DUF6158 family protein [Allostreptomyces psammosilenae]NYI04168.1 hypothetical protein [Allostreptomyces psammosilenae]